MSQRKNIDSKYKPDSPRTVNPLEENRLNIGICFLSKGETFIPHEKVRYIWLLNEDNEIIIGIEHPFDYLDAFDEKSQEILKKNWNRYEAERQSEIKRVAEKCVDKDAKVKTGMGHPTLTTKIDEIGASVPEKALIGGEFYFDAKKEKWRLNNISGRYFQILADDNETISEHLQYVADEIEKRLHIKVKIEISGLKDKMNPAAIWDKAINKPEQNNWTPIDHAVNLIKKIFKYTLSQGKKTPEYKSIASLIEKMGLESGSLEDFINKCRSSTFDQNIEHILPSINMVIIHQKIQEFLTFLDEKVKMYESNRLGKASPFNANDITEETIRTPKPNLFTANDFKDGIDSPPIANKKKTP